jgi:ppGpp synthetase/RelA/SpoT-type nucleotidyltranferase
MTKAQIDRLGERLRKGMVAETDLRLLDQYRRSFADAYDSVVEIVRDRLGQQPTGRPAKSTTSIVDKLKRESIRLSQIQDIAGCRLVVADILAQQRVVDDLSRTFDKVAVVDRRERPSHGYRAVHVIVSVDGTSIEIQVRTTLQHLWAELSEKFSDLVDPAIKYGGGPDVIRSQLADTSMLISNAEVQENKIAADEAWLAEQREMATNLREPARSTLVQIAELSLTPEQLAAKEALEQNQRDLTALELKIAAWQERVRTQKETIEEVTRSVGRILQQLITGLPARKGEKGAVLD